MAAAARVERRNSSYQSVQYRPLQTPEGICVLVSPTIAQEVDFSRLPASNSAASLPPFVRPYHGKPHDLHVRGLQTSQLDRGDRFAQYRSPVSHIRTRARY